MRANTRRVNLLPDAEIDAIYALPAFNKSEQLLYFEFTDQEIAIAKQYRTTKAKVYWMLSLAYFKAKQQFYLFDLEKSQDAGYVLRTYFSSKHHHLSGRIDDKTYRKQKEDILILLGYQNWSSELEPQIKSQLCKFLRYYPKTHSAFRQLLGYFKSHRIVIPGYRTLQDIFSAAFATEEKRLNQIIRSIPKPMKKQLSALIKREEGISQLNIIRADQKNFQYTAIKEEVKKAQSIAELYVFSKEFIPALKLSKNAVHYYAQITEQYAASRLRRLSTPQQCLHTLCFIQHRYRQIMDNLITSFLYHTKLILESGKMFAETELMAHSSKLVVDFPKLVNFLKWFPTRDEKLSHDELNKVAYDILPKTQFSVLAKFFDEKAFDKKAAQWQFYLKSSRILSLYLRPILMTVDFMFYKEESQVMELISLLKTHYANGKGSSRLNFSDDFGLPIPKKMIQYLKNEPSDKQLNPCLLEFFIYQKMYHHINRGRLCCNDSISYCDIDHDLIDDALVDNIDKIATEFGYAKLPIYCDERLDEAIAELDHTWDITTGNIQSGHNPNFNLKKESKSNPQEWSLLYDSSEKLDDSFFKTLPKVEIADVVLFIGNLIDMWDGFSHIKGRYIKRAKPIVLLITACILSDAFGFGEIKMADMSDLSFNLLHATSEDFIRIDTLCAVNDIISNYIHALPIFRLWNLLDDKLLADADGQKFATSDNTLQSRYSKKYLGKGRGISLYTLIANFVAVNAKNIGLNEYEGHSLYDMIYSNKTDIDIDMVTGDNHSLNRLNFIVLDSIDVEYVPSIKNVRDAADDLYSVKSPNQYTGLLLPKDKINIDRIKSQKRGILRVLLSLILQENTQSNIIRKLNSHARYARLKAALFEYNRILKSTHVLNLIDNMSLRKAIRTARNRTEAYHQLQSLIRKIYNGIFRGKKIVSNRVSAHAARLIANCIIAYNSTILNDLYGKMRCSGTSQDIINEFARVSPIAWAHILLTGRYSFKKSKGDIDIAEMAKVLERYLKQSFWKI